jgi:hypothetical protein
MNEQEIPVFKSATICTALIAAAIAISHASEHVADAARPAPPAQTRVEDYIHVFDRHESAREIGVVDGVLTTIAQWLSHSFDLPPSAVPPHVEFVAPVRLAALRYKSVLPVRPGQPGDTAPPVSSQDVLAVYDDDKEFIYLPTGWSGKSRAEMSILVHEMVHHLQNQGKLEYNCPQEREKLAYAAQSAWLEHFGTSLEGEFGIDPFSLIVKIQCIS